MKVEKEAIDPSVTFHALDRGDVVRLNDDEGDFIVFSLDDVMAELVTLLIRSYGVVSRRCLGGLFFR